MEKIEFLVHGERASALPDAIRGFPRNKRVDYDGNGFVVIVTEQYYFRTNSDLLATTIFELVDETTCKVTIISGGGGSGFLGASVGSESAESNKLVGKIEDFCDENALEIEWN